MRAVLSGLLAFVLSSHALAAVGCVLEHPDRDVRRLVPEATTYKVRELIPAHDGRKDLLPKISKELESPFDPEFETATTPYTFYNVFKGTERVARILGVNARGADGLMQVFVAYDAQGVIRDVDVQHIAAADEPAFRAEAYRRQFKTFGIANPPGEADIKPPVRMPSAETLRDQEAFLRAVRLNILLTRDLYGRSRD